MVGVIVDMTAPSTSPTRVKRRLTPSNGRSRSMIVASSMPSSIATAIAASAFWTLWRPGIGRYDPLDHPPLAVALRGPSVEPRAAAFDRDIVGANVGQRRESVGHHPPIADPAEDILHFGMIDAHHREPVEGHILDELDEGVLDRSKLP